MASRWTRWSPLSGIIFVVFFLVGLSIAEGADADGTDAEVVAYFADSGNTATEVAGFFITVVGALFFFVFLNSLRARLAAAEGPRGTVAGLASMAGLVSIVFTLAASVTFASMAAAVEFTDGTVVDPNTVRMLESVGFGFFICAGMTASVLVAATSVLALKTDVLPSWLGWLGIVVAIALLATVFWVPWLALLLWILLVSITMIVRVPQAANAGSELGSGESVATG